MRLHRLGALPPPERLRAGRRNATSTYRHVVPRNAGLLAMTPLLSRSLSVGWKTRDPSLMPGGPIRVRFLWAVPRSVLPVWEPGSG